MLEPLVSKLNDLRVILASSSEQRVNLLRSTRIKFEVIPSNFEENLDPKEHTCSDFVEKTALGKVSDVWERLKNDNRKPDVIIGVDTMVSFNGKMYGKPSTKEEAIKIIKDLTQRNIPNIVYSGVVIRFNDRIHKFTEATTVHMLNLSDEDVETYVETGEPMGKAGGYGVQGIAGTFVKRIEGDVNNVIGLPLCRLARELKKLILNKTV